MDEAKRQSGKREKEMQMSPVWRLNAPFFPQGHRTPLLLQWREFWGMPTYTGHCRGRTHWRESRVFGEEDRALEGCGITGSKEAEVKKAGVGTGGGSGPVQ